MLALFHFESIMIDHSAVRIVKVMDGLLTSSLYNKYSTSYLDAGKILRGVLMPPSGESK